MRGFLIGCVVGAVGMFAATEALRPAPVVPLVTATPATVDGSGLTVVGQVSIGPDVHTNTELFPAIRMDADHPHLLATCDRFSPEALDQLRDIAK